MQHDLGGPFITGATASPVPLRTIVVSAQPVVNGVAMNYREAANPTQRGSYVLNRWAAPPAAMVEAALTRLMAVSGTGRCRLQVSLSDFIVDIDKAGDARAVLAADLRIVGDASVPSAQRSVDIAVPMPRAEPAAGALALRQAVQKLGETAAMWLGGDVGRACKVKADL
ncbi:MAG TPA: hypothetical protein VFW00_09240 [Rhodocyclaceae bacterium]|nr:hypothetical protein [Rhodocyclaceae bacterium]